MEEVTDADIQGVTGEIHDGMGGVTDADIRGVTGEILAIVLARLDGYDGDAGPASRRLSSWQVDDRGRSTLARRAARESLRSPRRFALVFSSEMEAALGMAHYCDTLRLTRGGRERWERRLDELWIWIRHDWPAAASGLVTAGDLGQTLLHSQVRELAVRLGAECPPEADRGATDAMQRARVTRQTHEGLLAVEPGRLREAYCDMQRAAIWAGRRASNSSQTWLAARLARARRLRELEHAQHLCQQPEATAYWLTHAELRAARPTDNELRDLPLQQFRRLANSMVERPERRGDRRAAASLLLTCAGVATCSLGAAYAMTVLTDGQREALMGGASPERGATTPSERRAMQIFTLLVVRRPRRPLPGGGAHGGGEEPQQAPAELRHPTGGDGAGPGHRQVVVRRVRAAAPAVGGPRAGQRAAAEGGRRSRSRGATPNRSREVVHRSQSEPPDGRPPLQLWLGDGTCRRVAQAVFVEAAEYEGHLYHPLALMALAELGLIPRRSCGGLVETAWGPPAFYAACLAYALGGDTGAEGSWGLPTGAEAWRGVTPERLSVALAAAVRNTDVLVDEQRIPAADVMLAGLRFVRQGERARLEVNNLGRFALHAATRRAAALDMGDGADLGMIYEAAGFLRSQCCTADYCACSEAALFCALQVHCPPPDGCLAPDLRPIFLETATPDAARVACDNCRDARGCHESAGGDLDYHPEVMQRQHGLEVLSSGIWRCWHQAERQAAWLELAGCHGSGTCCDCGGCWAGGDRHARECAGP